MTTIEVISKPYQIKVEKDDDRVVRVSIESVGESGELTQGTLEEATRIILRSVIRGESYGMPTQESNSDLELLVRLYREGRGQVSDEYLAQLAVCYSRLTVWGRRVWPEISEAMEGVQLSTLRFHLTRCRAEGFLTKTTQGKGGGEPTEKSRQILSCVV